MSTDLLGIAQKRKADEFYTQLPEIEAEMRHYKEHFKDKVVLCNCDDPYESNFFKYFAMNFNYLGLKKLIATCYAGSPVAGEQLPLFEVKSLKEKNSNTKFPYKIEINEVKDENTDGAIDLSDVEFLLKNHCNILIPLNGDGDFR
ncbi:MAG: adenine-specific methyltransferase EcoRI family protein [Anaerolineae bacterium]